MASGGPAPGVRSQIDSELLTASRITERLAATWVSGGWTFWSAPNALNWVNSLIAGNVVATATYDAVVGGAAAAAAALVWRGDGRLDGALWAVSTLACWRGTGWAPTRRTGRSTGRTRPAWAAIGSWLWTAARLTVRGAPSVPFVVPTGTLRTTDAAEGDAAEDGPTAIPVTATMMGTVTAAISVRRPEAIWNPNNGLPSVKRPTKTTCRDPRKRAAHSHVGPL